MPVQSTFSRLSASTETHYDLIIIGAGAVGCALARNLSRFRLDILLLEAGDDVASAATRANSGIVHGGYAAKNGSLKARYCLEGNRMFPALSEELDFPYRKTGSVALAFNQEDLVTLERLLENGRANSVEGLEILNREEVLSRIPRLNPAEVMGALYCPGTGIVSPYEYAIAMMENALANGVQLELNSRVSSLTKLDDGIGLIAGGKEFRAGIVVNSAGAGSADVAALAGKAPFSVNPRKGQYIVFRRGSAEGLDTVVFQPPTAKGKGILVTPTTWGNLLLGPDASENQDAADLGTDPESLARIVRTARRSVDDFNLKDAIRVFSGNRPAGDRGDFIIEWSETMPGLLHLAGIESPGLTASPAIAKRAVELLADAGLPMNPDPAFETGRRAPVHPAALKPAAEAARAASLQEGDSQRIVCRCEQVTEGSIRDALSRGIPLSSIDAVKRRTRAGMGACQGAFCAARVRSLMASVRGIDEMAISAASRDREAMKADLDAMRSLLSEGSSHD